MASHKCAFCGETFPLIKDQTYRKQYINFESVDIREIDATFNQFGLRPGGCLINFYKCPNQVCEHVSIYFQGIEPTMNSLNKWIHPDYLVKQLPSYIPIGIAQDYCEACKILELSPRASATLSRRTLQSMIRDFWNVNGLRTLHDEINAIKDKISDEEYESLMALKSIGNIGAHPEQNINVILDINSGEAQQLIELIDLFVDEWYTKRENRRIRISKVKELGETKKIEKTQATPNQK